MIYAAKIKLRCCGRKQGDQKHNPQSEEGGANNRGNSPPNLCMLHFREQVRRVASRERALHTRPEAHYGNCARTYLSTAAPKTADLSLRDISATSQTSRTGGPAASPQPGNTVTSGASGARPELRKSAVLVRLNAASASGLPPTMALALPKPRACRR